MKQKTVKAAASHAAFLRSMGLDKDSLRATAKERKAVRKRAFVEDYTTMLRDGQRQLPGCSNLSHGALPDATAKRSVLNKPGPNASQAEVDAWAEACRKAKMTAPAYNKGGYQFLTPQTDPTTIGRKI